MALSKKSSENRAFIGRIVSVVLMSVSLAVGSKAAPVSKNGGLAICHQTARAIESPRHPSSKRRHKGNIISSPDFRGVELAPGFFQRTGIYLKPGFDPHPLVGELADPSRPFVTADGHVDIFGSGANYFISYPSIEEFKRAGRYDIVPFQLKYANGYPISSEGYGGPWDVNPTTVNNNGEPPSIFYNAGVMIPKPGQLIPLWPGDNSSRRHSLFSEHGDFVGVIVGKPDSGWEHHGYGGTYFQPENEDPYKIERGRPFYFFFDGVSEVRDGNPYVTAIYVQKMDDFLVPAGPPVKIVDPVRKDGTFYPGSMRSVGGALFEGPRPLKSKIDGKDYIVLGLSGGDFPLKSYTMSFAWSALDRIMVPYSVVENEYGDVRDFGLSFKEKYGLTALGRPSPYILDEPRVLFHGHKIENYPGNYDRWDKDTPVTKINRLTFDSALHIWRSDGKIRIQVGDPNKAN